MKAALVESHRERIARIESGEQVLVGVNRFTETEPSPLTAEDGGILVVDPGVEAEAREALTAWRAQRGDVSAALDELRRVAASDENIMEATLAAARAGVTTGEWAGALRDVFGSYRAPTGVGEAASPAADEDLRDEVARVSRGARADAEDPRRQARARRPLQRRRADRRPRARRRHGRRLRGHPPHPRADRPLGGRRGRPRDRPLDPVRLAPRADPGRDRGLDGADIPVVVGGIIPDADVPALKAAGVAAVYTPKDFELDRIMRDIVALVAARNAVTA